MKNLGRFWVFSFAILFSVFVFSVASFNTVSAVALVNINTASLTDLETIPGVGPAIGQRIIDYRIASGPFSKIEDIVNVKGIGSVTFSKMKDYITVSAGSGGTGGGALVSTSTNSGNSGLADDANDTSSDSSTSAHYEEESLSNYEETVSGFKVSAGRDRVTYVGSPVSFEAKTKISSEIKNKHADYLWTFGDGSSSSDEKVIHIYKYSGEYNVVLNGTLDDINSVSRAVVRVLAPSLTMTVLPDLAIEITNKGAEEINLYGWKLQAGSLAYSFPLDTIVSAGKKVAFPAEYTKIASNSAVALVDATSKIVAQYGSNLVVLDPDKAVSVADLERFVLEYRRLSDPTRQRGTLTATAMVTTSTTSGEYWSDRYDKVTEEALSTSSVAVIDEEEGDVGFWSKVFHPVRTIKNAFYK
jgi:competence protein ComEA